MNFILCLFSIEILLYKKNSFLNSFMPKDKRNNNKKNPEEYKKNWGMKNNFESDSSWDSELNLNLIREKLGIWILPKSFRWK